MGKPLLICALLSILGAAQAANFSTKDLQKMQERIIAESLTGAQELGKKHLDKIQGLFKDYNSKVSAAGTDEERLRALLSVLGLSNGRMTPEKNSALTIKQQREVYYQALARVVAEEITSSIRRMPPEKETTYRLSALNPPAYDPQRVRHALAFAAALISESSSNMSLNEKESRDLMTVIGEVCGAIVGCIGFAATIVPSASWGLALPLDAVALLFVSTAMPHIGLVPRYRRATLNRAVQTFLGALLPALNLDNSATNVKALGAALKTGDITPLLGQLCRNELEPPATPVPATRVEVADEAADDDERAEGEAADPESAQRQSTAR